MHAIYSFIIQISDLIVNCEYCNHALLRLCSLRKTPELLLRKACSTLNIQMNVNNIIITQSSHKYVQCVFNISVQPTTVIDFGTMVFEEHLDATAPESALSPGYTPKKLFFVEKTEAKHHDERASWRLLVVERKV